MNAAGSLELAQARLSARHGARADDALWRRVEHIRGLPALLDCLRTSPLAHWIPAIVAGSDAHAIEAALRRAWRAEVAVTATWMPEAWQPAVRWWATWPDLAVIDHLQGGGARLPWMDADALYRDVAPSPSDLPSPSRHGSAARSGAVKVATTAASVERWCAAWHRALPPGASKQPMLGAVMRALTGYRGASAATVSSPGALLRRDLQARLRLLFRAATLDPALAFVHLALSAFELERLRAELLRHVLFPTAVAA